MPESLNPTRSERRWRLIDTRGKADAVTIPATQRQADEFGRELSHIYGNRVLVTELTDKGIPINHHYVGKNSTPINQQEGAHTMSATTSMAKEPRTSNGQKGEVVTDLDSAKTLTPEQRETLRQKREAAKASGGKKTTAKKATPVKATTPKAPREHRTNKADLGQALTVIRRTLKGLPEEQHETATSIRSELTSSWKSISGGLEGLDGYIATVQAARKLALGAKLEDTVKATDAAIKLAQTAKAQS